MKTTSFPFMNPFPKNHCVVLAFTTLQADPTADFAVRLAMTARKTRVSTFSDRFGSGCLLDSNGASTATARRMSHWCKLVGLRVVETYDPVYIVKTTRREVRGYYTHDDDGNHVPATIEVRRRVGRPTLAKFLRTTGRRGRWFVLVRHHAVAVINGRAYGNAEARSRVITAFKMETV